jgi:hypothetical protein
MADSLKGIGGARVNSWRHRDSPHPHNRPYSHQCLRCQTTTPYFDGFIYWSLCLRCMQEAQCGPFRVKDSNEGDYSK